MQQSRSELFARPPSLALPVCPPLISRPMSNVIVRSASDESISGGEPKPAPGPGAQHGKGTCPTVRRALNASEEKKLQN